MGVFLLQTIASSIQCFRFCCTYQTTVISSHEKGDVDVIVYSLSFDDISCVKKKEQKQHKKTVEFSSFSPLFSFYFLSDCSFFWCD